MKKRKLKGFVLPSLYLLITISIFTGIIFLGSDISFQNIDYDYSLNALKDKVESVIVEDTLTTSEISSPVEEGSANISVHFYSKDATKEIQQNSLIYYENTYLPNTGVLYTSDNVFDVKSVFNGVVTEIIDDEFFGKCVVVEHTSSIRTYYYGLSNIEVEVNDELEIGTVIGQSQQNTIMNNKKSFLFEVYHNNELLNPETFIGTKITEYN